MIESLKTLGVKRFFFLILTFLIATDIVILLNIPVLRQILGFLVFTILPGVLILQILKLNKIEYIKKFVLSVGLSISFLMFVGFFFNQLYLAIGISEALSTSSLVSSFTFILVILVLIAYKRNKDDFNLLDILNVKFNLKKDQFTSPLFFPILFPFLAVFGTYLMNTEGDNIILITMLFLIPAYVVLLVFLKDRIPKITYPVAILAMSTALVLMHGLTSHYLNGQDVHTEFYAFRVVATNLYWSISNYPSPLTACLSTSLLPTVYWSLSGIDKIYIYKAVYQIIWAFTPLICYILFKKYVGELYAFLASFFFMSQMGFIYTSQSAMRTELAIFFFALAAMVFFDYEIDKLSKTILFLIFMFSVIVSHYSTSYVFFIMVFMLWLTTMLTKRFVKLKYITSATIVMLFFAMIFLWYSQLTLGFDDLVGFARNTFITLGDMFVEESREQSLFQSITGQMTGNPTEVLARRISLIVHWITFIFIFIGVIDLIKTYRERSTKFEVEYLLMTFISGCLAASVLILPHVSGGYGVRAYTQTLVFLALGLVIGGESICKYFRRPRFTLVLIMIVLISQFFCASFLLHQMLGVPYSEDLNRAGRQYGIQYIHGQDVTGAKWLNTHSTYNSKIYTDMSGWQPFLLSCEVGKKPHIAYTFFIKNETITRGYIYLRYVNVVDKGVYPYFYENVKNITIYQHLFLGKSKIYNNGGSEVWR